MRTFSVSKQRHDITGVNLSVLPGGDEADLQLDLSLMLLVNLKHHQNFTEFLQFS